MTIRAKKCSQHKDFLTTELELHKVEYSALRAEILHWLDTERQLLNLSIVAVGAGLGITPLIIERQIFGVLLIFPIVFHVLLWEMLNALKSTAAISYYLSRTLVPRVNVVLDELGNGRQDLTVLAWETSQAKKAVKVSKLAWASITPTRHWLPILAIAACLIAYSMLTTAFKYQISINEFWLVIVNLVFLVLASVQNVMLISRYKFNPPQI